MVKKARVPELGRILSEKNVFKNGYLFFYKLWERFCWGRRDGSSSLEGFPWIASTISQMYQATAAQLRERLIGH